MPYYPSNEEDGAHYSLLTNGEKLVMDYCQINIFEVQEMEIDLYLFFMREAYIHSLMQSNEGKEYLENCWKLEQTKPERKKLREKYGKKSGE